MTTKEARKAWLAAHQAEVEAAQVLAPFAAEAITGGIVTDHARRLAAEWRAARAASDRALSEWSAADRDEEPAAAGVA